MKALNVDLVLVVDASESMGPCFAKLRQHLGDLLFPLQQANFRVRFGLLAYAAGRDRSGVVYDHTFVGGSGPELLQRLYSRELRVEDYFTSDPDAVVRALGGIKPQGNEDSLLALDIAADFPFGPMDSTRRVITLFTDERLEDGISGGEPMGRVPELIGKLMERRIHLFVAAPLSDGLELLGAVDRAQIEYVAGGDGLQSVDFQKLLAQMGKSMSVGTLQAGSEQAWKRALFGQDQWTASRSASEATRRVVLAVGESARLNTAEPLTNINVKLQWTAEVDLDLHAFIKTKRSQKQHVYFGHRKEPRITLDEDAGIGDVGGQNEENITITALDEFEEILFATKIFTKGGCYADYDGRVAVQTNNGDDITVPLTARERADWCVIAKITNDARQGPAVVNVNQVANDEPDTDSF